MINIINIIMKDHKRKKTTRKKKTKNVGLPYHKYTIKKKNLPKQPPINKNIINPPISNNIHLGTAETLSAMNYNYLHYSNIYKFLKYIIEQHKIDGEYILADLCIPDFGNINIGTYASIEYDLDKPFSNTNPSPSDKSVSVSESLKCINDCINKKNTRFIVLSLQIISKEHYITHANSIIIDTNKKIIELFEPHGALTKSSTMGGVVGAHIRITTDMERFINNHFPQYKYMSPKKYLPSYGLQIKIDAYSGMCVTWNILYIHFRLLNPNMSPKNLVTHINKWITLNKLLRYAKYVKVMLKFSNKYILRDKQSNNKSNIDYVKSNINNPIIKSFNKSFKQSNAGSRLFKSRTNTE